MYILLLEKDSSNRALMRARIIEAARQAQLKSLDIIDGDYKNLDSLPWATIVGVVLGPDPGDEISLVIGQVRGFQATSPISIVLDDLRYQSEGVQLAKRFNVTICQIGDLGQLAAFLITCDERRQRLVNRERENLVCVAQLKGGVGATSLAAALSACWAQNGLRVVLIDLDDVNPHITNWAKVSLAKRTAVAEHLALGHIPEVIISELLHGVANYDEKLQVLGQPETYHEAFQWKAPVIDGAPSSSELLGSLIPGLKTQCDIIVVDLGRSWGVGTFSVLREAQRVLLACDGERSSVKRTIENLRRLRRDSDDPQEFDMPRWDLVVNGYHRENITLSEIRQYIEESEIFSAQSRITTIPFSIAGRKWDESEQTLLELGDLATRRSIEQLAYSLVPYRIKSAPKQSLLKKITSLLSSKIFD